MTESSFIEVDLLLAIDKSLRSAIRLGVLHKRPAGVQLTLGMLGLTKNIIHRRGPLNRYPLGDNTSLTTDTVSLSTKNIIKYNRRLKLRFYSERSG